MDEQPSAHESQLARGIKLLFMLFLHAYMLRAAPGTSALSSFKSPHPNETTMLLHGSPTTGKAENLLLLNTLAKHSDIHGLTCTFSLNLACHLGVDGSSRLLKTAVLKALPFPCPQNKTPAMPAPLVYLNPTQPNS